MHQRETNACAIKGFYAKHAGSRPSGGGWVLKLTGWMYKATLRFMQSVIKQVIFALKAAL